MASTHTNTDEVLAAARKDLEGQLAVVREQIARLTAEERALTHAISALDGGNPATSSAGTTTERAATAPMRRRQRTKSSARKASSTRPRRRRGASKSTADRVNELRELLADGPKSRGDLAAALNISPARVQQLLAELGSSVSSQPDPAQRRGKLWTLKGGGDGASAPKPAANRGTRSAKARPPRKRSARRPKAAK
jgi:chromosome segregation ATPase